MPAINRPQPTVPQSLQATAQSTAAFRPVGIRAVAATLATRSRTPKAISPKDIPAILRAEAQLD